MHASPPLSIHPRHHARGRGRGRGGRGRGNNGTMEEEPLQMNLHQAQAHENVVTGEEELPGLISSSNEALDVEHSNWNPFDATFNPHPSFSFGTAEAEASSSKKKKPKSVVGPQNHSQVSSTTATGLASRHAADLQLAASQYFPRRKPQSTRQLVMTNRPLLSASSLIERHHPRWLKSRFPLFLGSVVVVSASNNHLGSLAQDPEVVSAATLLDSVPHHFLILWSLSSSLKGRVDQVSEDQVHLQRYLAQTKGDGQMWQVHQFGLWGPKYRVSTTPPASLTASSTVPSAPASLSFSQDLVPVLRHENLPLGSPEEEGLLSAREKWIRSKLLEEGAGRHHRFWIYVRGNALIQEHQVSRFTACGSTATFDWCLVQRLGSHPGIYRLICAGRKMDPTFNKTQTLIRSPTHQTNSTSAPALSSRPAFSSSPSPPVIQKRSVVS